MANLQAIVDFLDTTFRVREIREVIGFRRIHAEAGVDLRPWVEGQFLERTNGLFLRGAPEVPMVAGVVFPSRRLIQEITGETPPGTMLFSHHPMDDEFLDRGFLPTDIATVSRACDRSLSMYYLHLPLDLGVPISTTSALVETLGLEASATFFPYQTGNLGLLAKGPLDRGGLLSRIRERLGIRRVQAEWYDDSLGTIAVVAGGGDAAEFVEAAAEAGCHTYLNGIVHNHVNHPEVRRDNDAFLKAAQRLRMNLIGVTHYASEAPAINLVLELLRDRFGVEVRFFPDTEKIESINRLW